MIMKSLSRNCFVAVLAALLAMPAAAQEMADEALAALEVEDAAPATQDAAPKPKAADEIVVSASYREQNVQDVVGGIQVFGGEQLDKNGVTGLEDYLREVSSVSLQKSGVGKSNIAIRGISNLNTLDVGYADGSPTTGVYFNDIAIQGSGVFPDLDIFDLQRIEVLKGPQGTLYGEGSMGGAIKMIMAAPDKQEWRVRTAAATSQTSEAGDLNWDMRGAVNIPIIDDKLALRVVGTRRFKSGFVTYQNLGLEDPDDEDVRSIRAALSWQALNWLEANYTYLYDFNRRDQLPVVDDAFLNELINTRTEDQYAETRFMVHSLTLNADLGFADLKSVTSYFDTRRNVQRRIPILQGLVDNGTGGALPLELFPKGYTHVLTKLTSFSQELRLVSPGDERFDWVAGAFYRDRDQKFYQEKYEDFAPEDPAGLLETLLGPDYLALSGVQEAGFGGEPFEQMAVYGEINYEIIRSTLEVTLGARWFRDSVDFFQDTTFYGAEALLFASDPTNIDPATGDVTVYFGDGLTSEDVLLKAAAAWYAADNAMLYASVSRGFRSGTPNLFSALQSGPPIVRPDFVVNSEIGAKTEWFDNRLILNVAAYRIDWTDFQGLLIGTACLGNACGIPFAHLGNGGDAVVRGAELQAQFRPLETLTLGLGLGYNEGEITDPDPANEVKQGSELPNKPKWTVNVSANYAMPLWGSIMGEVGGSYTWVDKQLTVFQTEDIPDGVPIESYSMFKATLGVSGDNWRAQIFGENLTDERVIVARSLPSPQSSVMRPRTIGLRLTYDY